MRRFPALIARRPAEKNCLRSLRITLREMLDFNRKDAIAAVGEGRWEEAVIHLS